MAILAYEVVYRYMASDNTTTLHVIRFAGPVRLPLVDTHSAIKVDPPNYEPQKGGGINATILHHLELQNEVVTSCSKKKSWIPTTVTESLSVKFDGDAVTPLQKPSTLQVVHVRRQHIVQFIISSRNKRPRDLYNDPLYSLNSGILLILPPRLGSGQVSTGRPAKTSRKVTRLAPPQCADKGGRSGGESGNVGCDIIINE
ncbi:unnamed protein product [Phytophthora fragariaefolia]|uniref:Unnamed protein product n=1 Tax=Phytophthora fragariaefolia TaxID=1490495 RepID=A0A9W6YCS7_9STRA|nr:unnamed protein product [Phytophthora fragariaefolia]